MFTGIVQHLGTITDVAGTKLSVRIDGAPATSLEAGESVAVNGVDLTVAEHDRTTFHADVMPETLRRTALGRLAPGARVNLERAVRPLDRMSGHVVQGVVEGTALLRENAADDAARVLRFEAADHLIDNMLVKGPVALDGVSLTLVEVTRTTFAVSLVVHTQAHTTLVGLPAGALVNVETDVLGRYVAHHLSEAGARARPTTASTREGDRR